MKKLIILTLTTLLVACGAKRENGNKGQIVVSIEPLAWLVENMVDSTRNVSVLVPPSTSPETYEPTFRQIENLSNSAFYFSIGLMDFEKSLSEKISSVAPQTSYINLSDDVELMEGNCCSSGDHHGHNHGSVDPHIWLSPALMQKMAKRVENELAKNGLLNKAKSDSIQGVIKEVEEQISIILKDCQSRSFAIVHPSLSYFANEFNLHQIALEVDGKEPSARQIKAVVEQLENNNIDVILYSIENSDAVAKIIANEIDAQVVTFNPLAKNWAEEMIEVSKIISKEKSK